MRVPSGFGRGKKDKLNVRMGQYQLVSTDNLYAKMDEAGVPTNEHVKPLIDYWDGSVVSEEVNLLDVVIASGDVPLCAVTAVRPEGDLSPLVSYAPDRPCHGYFEHKAAGSTEHERCTVDADCDVAAGEKCRGFETVVDEHVSTERELLAFCERY